MKIYQYPPIEDVVIDTTGLSTSAKQDTGNSSLASIDGKFTTLNAKDFATTAKQDTGNSSLTSIDGKFTTLNAKDFATSAKQDTTNTKLDSLIAIDYATEAKQDTTNTKLDSLIAIDYATEAKQDTTNTKLDSIIAVDFATEAKQDTTNTKLDTIITNTSLISANTNLNVVDQIDTTPLLSVSSSNIPASTSNSLQLVATLAAAVKKVVTIEDIGEFFGLYSGPVATPTLLCVLPLGGGEMSVSIPAGTLISIRHMKNTAVTSGFIAINFLG